VHTLLDRALPQPLEGAMSAVQRRLKRTCDAGHCTVAARVPGIKHKVVTQLLPFYSHYTGQPVLAGTPC